ncbi:MAG: hypothetical protein GOMPHAMPRED_001886 [Gomphillus americanus]|uniref:NADH dehydrogenase [ubiquinone] 1 beta subcomplex subunit 11, mitochondrial n=1 Tax=Gomphillus americanus TaxID=1940652 RepID=A0A8H3IN64_9LECA|nr:MAG: hypothetical protein GOMPHAMPRED_001886 [Gomphillus americanus]
MSSLRPLKALSQSVTRAVTSSPANKTPITSAVAITSPHRSTNQSLTHSKSAFSTTSIRPAASHDDHYDPPGGWLFGVPPGEKYEKEGWEGLFYWGFCGSFAVAAVALAFKPDTSIQTWALEEARRRLEAEGFLPDPDAVEDSGESD